MLTAQSAFQDNRAGVLALFDAVTITPSAPRPAVVAAILEGDAAVLPG